MMSIASHPMSSDLSETANGLTERIVEDLWQKGYDLKRAGLGWIIQEPLGSKKIELSSDVDLIRFASSGGRRQEGATIIDEHRPPQIETTLMAAVSISPLVDDAVEPAIVADSVSAPRYFLLFLADLLAWFWKMRWMNGLHRVRARVWQPTTQALLATGVLLLLGSAWWNSREPDRNVEQDGIWAASIELAPVQAISSLSSTRVSAVPEEVAEAVSLVRSNSDRVVSRTVAVEPLHLLPEVSVGNSDVRDLSLYSERCMEGLKQRFGLTTLTLLVNVEGRHAGECYLISGVEHCPYVSRGQATLNYLDGVAGQPAVYACDLNLDKGAYGNLRHIKANPDIVRFITSDSGVQ